MLSKSALLLFGLPNQRRRAQIRRDSLCHTLRFQGVVWLLALTFAQGAAAEILIGVAESLTGPASQYGAPILQGFELAAEQINAGGGIHGQKLRLIIEDERGKKEEAINVFKKLIYQDKVLMIFGPTLSNSMFAAGPIANSAKVVAFGTSNTASGITEIGPFIFRNSPMESDVVPATLAVVKAHVALKRIGMIYGNDDAFTRSGFDVFKQTLETMQIPVVDTETYARSDLDFKAQLTKLKAAQPDAIVCPCLAEEGANILLQARALGMKMPFIGGNGFNTPKLIENARAAAEGTWVGSPWLESSTSAANRQFKSAFEQKFHSAPNQFAAQSHDALHLVALVLERLTFTGELARDREALRQALPQAHYAGATGEFAFRPAPPARPGKPAGYDAQQTPFVVVIHNGRFVPVH